MCVGLGLDANDILAGADCGVKTSPVGGDCPLGCHPCGCTAKENRATRAHLMRQGCGHGATADVNAARIILAAGPAAAAVGVECTRVDSDGRPAGKSCKPALAAGVPSL